MNTQYKDNVTAIMQVNKKYVDDKVEEVIELVADYDISTDVVSQLSTSAIAPSDVRSSSLIQVGGNCVKYAPSTVSDDTTANLKAIPENTYTANVDTIGNTTTKLNPTFASDDTTALVKTMPATVYDFDGSKFYGDSEVSENKIALPDTPETTTNGITWKIQNGTIYLNGTASAYFSINLLIYCQVTSNVTLKFFDIQGTSSKSSIVRVNDTYQAPTTTGSYYSIITNFVLYTDATHSFTNYQIKPMLVVGSTAPTEFKVGFSDIHNIELTGIRSESQNILKITGDYTQKRDMTATYNDNTFKLSGTPSSTGLLVWTLSENLILPKGTYYFKAFTNGTFTYDGNSISFRDVDNNYYYAGVNDVGTTFTLTKETTINRINFYVKDSVNYNASIKIMLVRGSTAPTDYVPYVAPTTIPIDLTSIEDSGGNKLFADGSLKGVGNVADEITPYKAIKKLGYVDLGSLNWTKRSGMQNVTLFSTAFDNYKYVSGTLMLCANYNYGGTVSSYTAMDNKADKTLCAYYSSGQTGGTIYINDSGYETAEAFKTAMSGIYLVYELATPIEADIDFSFLKNIQGYSNGSITAQNTYDMAVHSEIKYNSIIENDYADSVVFSGNLADIQDVAQTTTNGITYKVENGIITLISGTATSGTRIANTSINVESGMSLGAFNSVGMNGLTIQLRNNEVWVEDIYLNAINKTGTFTNSGNSINIGVASGTTISSPITIKPMLVKGSTAPSVFKPYVAPITKQIASEIKALDGYNYGVSNTCFNYVDFNNKKFIKKEGKVKAKELDWRTDASNRFYAVVSGLISTLNARDTNVLSAEYTTNTDGSNMTIFSYSFDTTGTTNRVVVYDSHYNSDPTAFKNHFTNNDYIYYELATPVQTDISSYLDNFNPILTNDNYTNYEVISHNGSALPNKISYFGTIKETLVESMTITNVGEQPQTINLADTNVQDGWSVSNSIYNYRADRERKRHKLVGRVKAKDLTWTYVSANNFFRANISSLNAKYNLVPNILCNIYNTIQSTYTGDTHTTNGITFLRDASSIVDGVATRLVVVDGNYTDATTFTNHFTDDDYIYYELATEVVEDLDVVYDSHYIPLKSGGSITFNNANAQQCHNTIRYTIMEEKQ